jgi:hypothetical protein
MNAPFLHVRLNWRLARLGEPDECARIEAFLAGHSDATPFHRPAWLAAVANGTGNRALGLLAEQGGEIMAWLPLSDIHSPLFGRVLASSGFAVGGGVLVAPGFDGDGMFAAAEELAQRLSSLGIELRGGELPQGRIGWQVKDQSHCGFIAPLAADDEAQLLAIPRKQRAEVRKGLEQALEVTVGTSRLTARRTMQSTPRACAIWAHLCSRRPCLMRCSANLVPPPISSPSATRAIRSPACSHCIIAAR